MAASDLITLTQAQNWLGVNDTASNTILGSLITAMSRAIYGMMNRPNIFPATYSETFDGTGGSAITLKNWPALAVSSVFMDGIAVLPAPPLPNSPVGSYGMGWVLGVTDPSPPGRPATLYLRGGRWTRDQQNIAVTYTAGYQVAETQTIAAGALTAMAPYGAWATDQGVVYASNGTALVKVANSPAQGQYSVASGAYTFNSADNAASVILTYGFIPADLAQAALEWVALRFKSKDNVGWKSKSLGGQETMSVDSSAMPAAVQMLIQPFKRVAIL